VSTLGLTEEFTMVSTSKTKNMDSECTFGQIKKSTKGIGKMESNMGKADLQTLKANQELVFGKMAIESNGYLTP
jgi:hypothetical protein